MMETLDSKFKQYYQAVIDALEGEDKLEWEQVILDNHNNRVAYLFTHLNNLHPLWSPQMWAEDDAQPVVWNWLTHLEQSL